MLEMFKKDINRYFLVSRDRSTIGSWEMIKKVANTEALWIIFLYRLGKWLRSFRTPLVSPFLKFVYALVSRPLEIILDVHIHLDNEIGEGFYIGHCGGIWISPTKIGENCNISQQVTIGIGGRVNRGIPVIGNRVYIAPGAKIFGPIRIGDNVAIGANAVVSKNIPDNAVVIGNPGRIISYDGSDGMIEIHDDDL